LAVWDDGGNCDRLDEAGRLVARMESPGGIGPYVALSPDGTRIAWTKLEHQSRLCLGDATSGRPTAVCEGHQDSIWGLTFSPDGTRLASASEDRKACLWDSATGA